jgi:hypothetical protein
MALHPPLPGGHIWAADLGYSEGSLPAGGKLVGTLSSKHPPEHQTVHLDLGVPGSTVHF